MFETKISKRDVDEFAEIKVEFGSFEPGRDRRFALEPLENYILENELDWEETTSIKSSSTTTKHLQTTTTKPNTTTTVKSIVAKTTMKETTTTTKNTRKTTTTTNTTLKTTTRISTQSLLTTKTPTKTATTTTNPAQIRRRRAVPSDPEQGSGDGATCTDEAAAIYCQRFAKRGRCLSARHVAFKKCRNSCELCDVDECNDTRPAFCKWFKDTDRCQGVSDPTSKYTCPASCGLCDSEAECSDARGSSMCAFVLRADKCAKFGFMCEKSCGQCSN